MAEELIKRYTCDGPEPGAGVVRFVFQLPDRATYVTELCEADWSPIEAILNHAVKVGGARRLRDTSIKSAWLAGEESMIVGGASRPPLVATVTGTGRWVLGANPGMALHSRVAHWLPADASKGRCGFVSLDTLDFDNPPLSMNKQCGKCLLGLEADARQPAPPVSARAERVMPAIEPAPGLFSDSAVSLDGGKPGRGRGEKIAAAKALLFEDWPRHTSWEWIDHKTHALKVNDAYWKAHARPTSGERPSLCSRIPFEGMKNDALAKGENAMCALCMATANKIIRLEQRKGMFNG